MRLHDQDSVLIDRPSERPRISVASVVIVHRSQPDACVRTGQNLCDQASRAGISLELVVVDNGSSVPDLERVRRGLPGATLIEMGTNAGFGPGANAGILHFLSGDPNRFGDWVLVCPHDATPDEHCLERLLSAVSTHPHAGLASAEYGDAGTRVKPMVHPYCGSYLVASERKPGWEDAGYPHGTLMVASRACLEDIGLFDERYFAYCEEADLGERARRGGWNVGVVWGAVVRNPTMSSEVGVPEYLMVRNTLFLVREHFGLYRASVLLALTAWITLVGILIPSRRTPYWHLKGRVLGMIDYARKRTGPPPVRLTHVH